MEINSKSVEDTKKFAYKFATSLDDAHRGEALVVGLYGELGAGKTTFMKYFAEALGVKENIVSPTFVIMKRYKTSPPDPLSSARMNRSDGLPMRGGKENLGSLGGEVFERLIHIDAYRLEKAEELIKLGWNELLKDPQNIICIEWPERVAEIMPPHIVLRFEHVEDGEETERKISTT